MSFVNLQLRKGESWQSRYQQFLLSITILMCLADVAQSNVKSWVSNVHVSGSWGSLHASWILLHLRRSHLKEIVDVSAIDVKQVINCFLLLGGLVRAGKGYDLTTFDEDWIDLVGRIPRVVAFQRSLRLDVLQIQIIVAIIIDYLLSTLS